MKLKLKFLVLGSKNKERNEKRREEIDMLYLRAKRFVRVKRELKAWLKK